MSKRNHKELEKLNILLQDFPSSVLKRIKKKVVKKRKKILKAFDT